MCKQIFIYLAAILPKLQKCQHEKIKIVAADCFVLFLVSVFQTCKVPNDNEFLAIFAYFSMIVSCFGLFKVNKR